MVKIGIETGFKIYLDRLRVSVLVLILSLLSASVVAIRSTNRLSMEQIPDSILHKNKLNRRPILWIEPASTFWWFSFILNSVDDISLDELSNSVVQSWDGNETLHEFGASGFSFDPAGSERFTLSSIDPPDGWISKVTDSETFPISSSVEIWSLISKTETSKVFKSTVLMAWLLVSHTYNIDPSGLKAWNKIKGDFTQKLKPKYND